MLIFFATLFTVFLLGLIKQKSRIIMIVQLLMIWLLMGFNSGGIDFQGNEEIYYAMGRSITFRGFASSWLYNLTAYFAHHINLSFISYNIIMTFVVLAVFGIILIKESERPCFVLDMFMIYPLVDSIIQKRFFVGMMFCVAALFFLMRKRYMMFIAFIIIAIGFHFSFLFYCPLLFMDFVKEKHEKYYLILIVLLEMFILRYNLNLLRMMTDSGKIDLYLTKSSYRTLLVGVLFMIYLVGYILLTSKICNCVHENNAIEFLKKINMAAVVIVPLCSYDSTFFRYYRVILIFAIIVLANCCSGEILRKNKMLLSYKNKWYAVFVFYFVAGNIVLQFSDQALFKTVITNTLFK